MESTTVDLNGGNAEVARDEPNLKSDETPTTVSQNEISDNKTIVKMEEQNDVNGGVKIITKKKGTPVFIKKLRKFKVNSGSSVEIDAKPHTRGQKRKLSEPDLTSDESDEFNGFEPQNDLNESGSQLLHKLIAEAELEETPQTKKRRRSMSKDLKNLDDKDDAMIIDDARNERSESLSVNTVKSGEKESDTDSIGIPMSFESENDPLKTDDSSAQSLNNSSANSSPMSGGPKLKVGKIVRGVSPRSATKQKITVDMSNPLFREPFKYGWKRELVFRAGSEHPGNKRFGDIYYYTPKGKKVRSFREVAQFLKTKELTIDNFTFFKEPLGLNNTDYEVIRVAKVRDSVGTPPVTPTAPKKAAAVPPKKTPVKKIVEKPPPPVKVAPKSPKVAPAAFKIKLPAKKTPLKNAKSPTKEPEMLPPKWSSPASTRRSQPIVEKSPPAKPKRVIKAKLQEPCSIRCLSSMGLIPSLQCSLCLCLYHPECVGEPVVSGPDDYVCKNCHEDSDEPPQTGATQPPPPLIPISMLSGQGGKGLKTRVVTPPKLRKITKTESTEEKQPQGVVKKAKISRSSSSSPSNERNDAAWLQAGNEFLRGHDGTMPKPAQNIALMAGKRYIVVPKNNAMAVQPAITVRPDKIGEKAPTIPETLPHEISAENSHSRVSPKIPNDRPKLSDNELIRDIKETTKLPEIIETNDDRKICLGTSESNETTENSIDLPEIEKIDPITEKNEKDETVKIEDVTKLVNDLSDESTMSDEHVTTINPEMKIVIDKTDNATNSDNLMSENSETNSGSVETKILSRNSVPLLTDCIKKIVPPETDSRHFMVSVCAGYNALSKIFQYLKVQELLRAARVCKMWRDLAAHPNLWKTVRMKNSQVTDWDGFADSLKRHGTQHLDLRKMLVAGESDGTWKKFVTVVPRITSLVKLELCRCPVMVVEEVMKSCPQLEVLSAMSIKCDSLNLESVGNLKSCQELRLKAISGMSLHGDLTPLQELTQLTQLSLTSVKELGKKNIDVLASLINLETLELGECSDFPDKFGTSVILKLLKLERLRLEKGQGTCCTFDILEGVSKLNSLSQLELVNFDVKNGFDKCLANCKNIKRLLIIPTYISQSATSNNMVLGGVTELSDNLTHFVWGVTLELLRVTELFVDQCNQMSKPVTGDSIPVLKPVPCLKLIEDFNVEAHSDTPKVEEKPQANLTNPQVDILALPQLQKLLLTALPKTRVKILKIPFHATWRQSISDTTTQ